MQSSVNLLPDAAVGRYRKKQLIQAWLKIGMFGLALAGVTIFACQSLLIQQRRALHNIEATNAKPIAVRKANRELKIKLSKINRWSQEQLKLRSACSPLPVLELLTQIKRELNGAVEVESFDYIEQASSGQYGSVTITLKTDNPENSARIVQSFRDSELFKLVKLQSAIDTLKSGDETDLRFSMRCEF